jgi:hypothetical protein
MGAHSGQVHLVGCVIDSLWDVPSLRVRRLTIERCTTSPIVNFCTISEHGESSRTGHLHIGCDHFSSSYHF